MALASYHLYSSYTGCCCINSLGTVQIRRSKTKENGAIPFERHITEDCLNQNMAPILFAIFCSNLTNYYHREHYNKLRSPNYRFQG